MPQKHFAQRLTELEQRLLAMSHRVEGLLRASTELTLRGEGAPDEIVRGDGEIDAEEVAIEDACIELLALHQPMAGDLRLIVTILKINNDLERVGDHAVNIAEAVARLREARRRPPVPPELEEMSDLATRMLRDALDSLVHRNAEEGHAVGGMDDRVDALHESVFRIMLTHLLEHDVSACLQLILISRNLERVADLATNIGEDVVFMVEGTTIRHPSATAPDEAAGPFGGG